MVGMSSAAIEMFFGGDSQGQWSQDLVDWKML